MPDPVPPVAAVRSHVVALAVTATASTSTTGCATTRARIRTSSATSRPRTPTSKAMLAHVKPLENRIYDEIIARIKQDDVSVPYRKRGYWYLQRGSRPARNIRSIARKAGTLDAPEQVMLDVNALAKGFDFFQVGAFEVSPDNRMLAYAEDNVGRRQWSLRFKDLATGVTLPDRIANVEAGHRVGRRQPHGVLRREASRDAAGLQGPQARARHGSRTDDPARLRAGRHELLHRRRATPRTTSTS